MKLLAIGLTVALAIGGQSALAGTIDVFYSGSANFGVGPVGYEIGSVVPNPNSPTDPAKVGIGGDSFTSTNHGYDFSESGQFNTWCVDIYHWMVGGGVTYTVGTGSDLALALGADGTTRVAKLGQLANEVYVNLDTKTDSAAFQLAVWAISFGTADGLGHYQINTTDAGFRVDSATELSDFGVLANNWLDDLGNVPNTGHYALTYLNDGERGFTQDMIVFTGGQVPEPTTLALLGLGLAGLRFSKHKKA